MMQVDFAIISVRSDEFAAVLQRFSHKAYEGTSGRTYGIAEIRTKSGKNYKVAMVRSERGTGAAQQVANDIINDLDPQILLVVGIAGGIPSDDFTLGDVIISNRINNLNVSKRFEDGREEFDMGGGIDPRISNITAGFLLFQTELAGWNDAASINMDRPEVDLRQFESDEFRTKIAQGQKNASWYKGVRASITSHFGTEKDRSRPPLFEIGTIASSNGLIRNVDIFVQWLQVGRSILAVEMETAGVYQATQKIHRQYPVMAIRGISDIIGIERDNQWTKYACQTAAAFAHAFIMADILKQRKPKPRDPSVDPPVPPTNKDPIEVFISYSRDDGVFKEHLETHIAMLRRQGIIRLWNSLQIEPGREKDQEIARRINSAQLILLLISPSFLASDQLYTDEMMHAMVRHISGETRVIPIILRAVDLSGTPFMKLQALPRDGRPIERPSDDKIWSSIAQEIRQVCEHLREEGGG